MTLFPIRGSAKATGVDAANPVLEIADNQKTVLKLWQVNGLAWMLSQEAGPVKGGILANNYGLGKTVQALTLIHAPQPA